MVNRFGDMRRVTASGFASHLIIGYSKDHRLDAYSKAVVQYSSYGSKTAQ